MQLHPTYPLTTARLELRPLTVDDVDALLAYRGLAEVCRYLPFPPMTRQVLLSRLAGDLGRTRIDAEGDALTLGAHEREDGRLLGDVVLFFRSQEHRSGELGYVFHPDVAGRGYATEACAAVLALAFEELGLHRVVARLDARNAASARLAVRLGLRQEGTSVSPGQGEDVELLVFALRADQWPTSPAHRTWSSGR